MLTIRVFIVADADGNSHLFLSNSFTVTRFFQSFSKHFLRISTTLESISFG